MGRKFEQKATERAVAKDCNQSRQVFNNILPTNFEFELDAEDKNVIENYGAGGNEYKLIRKVLKGKLYGIIDIELERKRHEMDKCSSNIISYIIVNLPINCNYIEFTLKDYTEFHKGVNTRTYASAIKELVNKKVISLTNRKSLYIVNHNYIFKGNIIKFIENYNKKYENIVPSLDENGNIIIED